MIQKEFIDELFKKLDKTREELFKTADFLPSRSFDKRFDSKWDACELLGHLYKFEFLVYTFFENCIPANTSDASLQYNPKTLSQNWFDAMNNDKEKYNAPKVMKPERILKSDYKRMFTLLRENLKKSIYSKIRKDFSAVIIPHPNGNKLNLIQWLELMEAHEKRHIRQLAKLAFQ